MPDGWLGQLHRSFGHPALKQGRDSHQCRPRWREASMQSGQGDGDLPDMFSFSSDRGHQPGTAGDGLAPSVRMRQPDEQTPPIVNQCHGTSSQLTPIQVVCGAPPQLTAMHVLRPALFRTLCPELVRGETRGESHAAAGRTGSGISVRQAAYRGRGSLGGKRQDRPSASQWPAMRFSVCESCRSPPAGPRVCLGGPSAGGLLQIRHAIRGARR